MANNVFLDFSCIFHQWQSAYIFIEHLEGIDQKNLQNKKIKEIWGSNTVKERPRQQEE
jgi:hypothetical protein